MVWFLLACGVTGEAQAPVMPEYSVSTIKPHSSIDRNGRYGFSRDSFEASGFTLEFIAALAWNTYEPKQWIGWPQWAQDKRWDLQAKAGLEEAAAMKSLAPQQRFSMLQKVLEDRFGLVVHREKRELPVFALVVASGGPRLKPTTQNATFVASHLDGVENPARRGTMDLEAIDMEHFAPKLNFEAGRMVVNHTGLQGRYDFVLHFTPADVENETSVDPALVTALQEQLGLKLVPDKAPVDVIVVDQVREPNPN